jgi:prevent-host-death family protein
MHDTTRGNRRSRPARPVENSVTSADAQNNFGLLLSRARSEGRVFITRYDRAEAVLLSIEEYEALLSPESTDLQALDHEFDTMLAQMQRPEHRQAVDRFFSMRSEELGNAAVRGVMDE